MTSKGEEMLIKGSSRSETKIDTLSKEQPYQDNQNNNAMVLSISPSV